MPQAIFVCSICERTLFTLQILVVSQAVHGGVGGRKRREKNGRRPPRADWPPLLRRWLRQPGEHTADVKGGRAKTLRDPLNSLKSLRTADCMRSFGRNMACFLAPYSLSRWLGRFPCFVVRCTTAALHLWADLSCMSHL